MTVSGLNCRWAAWLIAACATLVNPAGVDAQDRAQPNPCLAPVTLAPVDEAARRPDFLEFRRRLQDAIARRDEAAVLAAVHPEVRTGFGGSGGIQSFKKDVVESRTGAFWNELATILRLGGHFRLENAFDAPYTFAVWPETLDSFECLAVIGERVRMRSAPRLSAPIVAQLDFAVVRAAASRTTTPGWRNVQLTDGRTGYVAAQYVRSPIDHRALFEFRDGRWWLMAYVAGD